MKITKTDNKNNVLNSKTKASLQLGKQKERRGKEQITLMLLPM